MWKVWLLLLAVVVLGAIKLLPWYVLVGLAVVLIAGLWLGGGRIVVWLFSAPFRAKGAVLKGASVTVHSIVACAPPARVAARMAAMVSRSARASADEDEDEEDEDYEHDSEPRQHYLLDVTITPREANGVFHHWEIGELSLGRPESRPMEDDDGACRVEEVKVLLDGRPQPDEGYKLPGPQRLHLLLGVKPNVRKLAFQYYFERFGEVAVPMAK